MAARCRLADVFIVQTSLDSEKKPESSQTPSRYGIRIGPARSANQICISFGILRPNVQGIFSISGCWILCIC